MKKRLAGFFYVYNGHINVNIVNMRKLNPFYRLLLIFTLLAVAAKFGGALTQWKDVPLWIMIQVFFLAGVSHFTSLRHEFVKMIPPKIPAKMFLVYLTGALELLGAWDLMNPENRAITGWALIALLVLMFPANYYAAKSNIHFRGAKPLSVLQRGAVQILFIVALYVGAIL
nr:hypothetical protein CKG001_32290 [Bdellovibrio sp. CKG001]